MSLIRFAAGTAVVIGAPTAAADMFMLEMGGEIDHVFNAFDPPLDGTAVGDQWDLKLGYDTDIGGTGTQFFQSFKNSLCSLELTLDGTTYDQDDFAQGECDIIITQDPCVCGVTSTIQFDFVLPSGAIGFNLVITDDGGVFLPLMELPTDQDDLSGLKDFVQFEFFSPSSSGSTARALGLGADYITISPKIPAPASAAAFAFAGFGFTRRRR